MFLCRRCGWSLLKLPSGQLGLFLAVLRVRALPVPSLVSKVRLSDGKAGRDTALSFLPSGGCR